MKSCGELSEPKRVWVLSQPVPEGKRLTHSLCRVIPPVSDGDTYREFIAVAELEKLRDHWRLEAMQGCGFAPDCIAQCADELDILIGLNGGL